MFNWKELVVSQNINIREAMDRINTLGGRGLYVTDNNQKLLGSITDGDIRRALIVGIGLSDDVEKAMKTEALWLKTETSTQDRIDILKKYQIESIPILDSEMKITDIFILEDQKSYCNVQVVLLAGGLGTRLGRITENLPKPMVRVAGEPILERIINTLKSQGFFKYAISVNYKAEIIEDFFKDGSHIGCDITYLKEDKRLGTAGPLSLLNSNGNPIIVMNADLLTYVNFNHILDFHKRHKSKITMCVRDHEVQIPFGVINIENGFAQSFHEKPAYNFIVNAGIYVIEPDVLKLIPQNEYYDMSTLLNNLLENERNQILCFPIVESWIDVGRESDLMYAQEFYKK